MRSSTGARPYSLVYGSEAVLPIEVEVQSLRVVLESEIPEAEWVRDRYEQLALIEEKIMRALYHMQLSQKRVAKTFNKHVKPKQFKEGDLVLKEARPDRFP